MILFSNTFLKRFFSTLFLFHLVVSLCFAQSSKAQKKNYQYALVIGTYTNSGKSEGIYTYEFNAKNGATNFKRKTVIADPSFINIGLNNQNIYSVQELGNNKGAVSAFSYNKSAGSLTLLNTVPSVGDHPCHINRDSKNQFVFVANYTGGNFSAIRIKKDGSLDSIHTQTIQHTGKSINTSRQEKAHVHQTVLSPDEKYLLVQDLGMDQISVYGLDLTKQTNPVSTTPISVFNTSAGSGPRHLVFHPNKKWAYSVQELNGTVNAMLFKDGKLNLLQTINMDASKSKRNHGAADIHISPDGKFLYASNRGDFNEIAIYSIATDGTLHYIAVQSTLGKAPRNFGIDPSGNFLLVGNHLSDEIVVFKRNKKTGLLTDTQERIKVGAPVCIQFVAL
ncbi:MAG: lactonase family protein [Sediminibacterium sp.]|nr:lactonase family protein [Sediminibacterium sp.]